MALVLSAVTAFGQGYPLPSNSNVICTNCPGRNAKGQLNAGLPLWPWSSPIKAFVGRYVDSVYTSDNQGAGMRTARAGRVKVAPTQRGTAPPRIYMQVGAALSAYRLDTFFTTKLPAGMVTVDAYTTGIPYQRGGTGILETVLRPEAFVYPESPFSGWQVQSADSQERLFDFDFDDRGYIYAAYSLCGWGIIKDDGKTDGGMLPKVSQRLGDLPNGVDIGIKSIAALKTSSGQYYAVVSDPEKPGATIVYDVTNAENPGTPQVYNRPNQSVRYWAKNATGDKFAFVDRDFKIQVYNTDQFVTNGQPIATFSPSTSGRIFLGVAGDNQGNFWGVETNGNLGNYPISRFSPSGGTFAATTFNVLGADYDPVAIESHDGFISITGFTGDTDGGGFFTKAYDPRVFKVDGTGPKPIDLKSFFKNYYHHPPTGFAKPDAYTRLVRGIVTVKQGSKVYLVYATHGIGDVFELVAGDSISINKGNSFGTPNPRSLATQTGPFYGDPMRFTAINGTASAFNLPVMWDFGNPEYPTANTSLTSVTGAETAPYQYGGLTSPNQITTAKTVTAKLTNDLTVFDSTTVSMKVPTPRVSVVGTNTVITTTSNNHKFVLGDTFADASDGSVEGHYNVWNIGGTNTNALPTATPSVGALGARNLTFTANYGPYNAATFAPLSPASYTTIISNVGYTVRPFVVNMGTHTASGTTYTFKGTARKTSDASVILPTQTTWSVTWSLKNGSTDVVPPVTTAAAPIGTIPDYVVTGVNASTLNGATLLVTVTVPTAGLSAAAQPFNSDSASSVLTTPDPVIQKSGCDNVGSPCSFTVTSATGQAMDDWAYSWTLAGPGQNLSGSSATFSPQFTAPGTYTVNLTVTKSIFQGAATAVQWTAGGTLCGALPTATQMYISIRGAQSGCTVNSGVCQAGESIQFRAQGQNGYVPQACDTYTWNFGDGNTAIGQTVNHSYAAGTQSALVTVTASNTHGNIPFTYTVNFTGGGGNPNPNPTCTAPSGIGITYAGSQGCGANTPCKTGEIVTFLATRSGGNLQACDTATWTFSDGDTMTGSQIQKTFTSPNSYTVNLTVTNTHGNQPAAAQTVVVTQGNQGGSCALPAQNAVSFTWIGAASGCTQNNANTTPCNQGETLNFTARWFNGSFSNCHRFEWDFGDGTSSTEQSPAHTFPTGNASYLVKVRVYNDQGQTLNAVQREVTFSGAPVRPVPEIAIVAAPSTAGRNSVLTFTAQSNLPNTTGWTWDFGDGQRDTTQAGNTSQTSTVSHAFTEARTYVVTVTARNSESPASAQTGRATRELTIVSTPEHRFLLPVVTHAPGQNSSVWRTDVQVFNSDPNVSASNPLVLKVTFKGTEKTINVTSSTYISEDFMRTFTTGNDSGPVILSVQSDYRPQIWTRTYNQASNGTFGQYIPAIALTDATSAVALPTTETLLYLPGLRSSTRYRTNVGFVNPMPNAMSVRVTAYDEQASVINSVDKTVNSFELVQFNVADAIQGLPSDKPYTVRVTVPANAWLIAYGSMIDMFSNDPTYVSAVSEAELRSTDYGDLFVPGVGRTGAWRSDVTIFNPGTTIDDDVVVDLFYYDAAGTIRAEARNVKIRPRQLLQLNDLLRAGLLTPQPADGTGVLRVKTISGWTSKFPLAYSRTYNDNGSMTFGQGIPSFAAARANVKTNVPAVIPAVRHDAAYYTNLGLVNLTGNAVRVKITLLREDTGGSGGEMTYDLAPFASQIGQIFPAFNNPAATRGSLKIEVVGTGAVWAFASAVDRQTTDPEYIQAVPLQ